MRNIRFQKGAARFGVIVGAAVLVLGSFAIAKAHSGPVKDVVQLEKPAPPIPQSQVAPLSDLQNAFTAIADRLDKSLVSIRVKKTVKNVTFGEDSPFGDLPFQVPQLRQMPRQYSINGAGSGIIVRSDGWILTNDHVVGGADRVTVKLHDGREFEGTVRRDYRSDLAVVKIPVTGLVPVEFGDSDAVKVGQWAVAFGSPFELDDTMTVGIISARSRQKAIVEGNEGRFYPTLLQTDASINPGNSGGPLVDIRGRLIGINVAINSPSGGSVGIGFAIPSNTAHEVMEKLINNGKVVRGFLGVVPAALTPTDRTRYGVKEGGALIEQVEEGSPAASGGVQVEDVVLKYNGKPITDDVSFRQMVSDTAPGTQVVMLVRRSGHEKAVTVTPSTAKDPVVGANASEPSGAGKLGVRVEQVTPNIAQRYNLEGVSSGVVVVQVESGGPGEEAGIQPGDIIVRANGRTVKTPAELGTATSSARAGDTVALVVIRDKSRVLISVRIP